MSLNLKKEVEHLNFEEEKPYQSAAVSIEVWLGVSTGKISPKLKANECIGFGLDGSVGEAR